MRVWSSSGPPNMRSQSISTPSRSSSAWSAETASRRGSRCRTSWLFLRQPLPQENPDHAGQALGLALLLLLSEGCQERRVQPQGGDLVSASEVYLRIVGHF